MKPKFPIWMSLVLGAQVLLVLAAIVFVLIIASAFSGKLSLTPFQFAVLAAPLLVIGLCGWLSRRQWHAGQLNAARMLVFAPLAADLALSLGAQLVMA